MTMDDSQSFISQEVFEAASQDEEFSEEVWPGDKKAKGFQRQLLWDDKNGCLYVTSGDSQELYH